MKLFRRRLIALAVLLGCTLLCLLALHKNSSIATEVWINSSPQQVWQVLTDTPAYPSWNPMISRLSGELREGNVIEFTEGTGSDGMTFRPKILRVRNAQELGWKGNVLLPGLFDGEHRFLLEKQGNQTHLIQSEQFTGLFVGKLTQGILNETSDQMNAMNTALKQRSETLFQTELPSGQHSMRKSAHEHGRERDHSVK
jgi:hypothetical protein